jgi:hypothetical protein
MVIGIFYHNFTDGTLTDGTLTTGGSVTTGVLGTVAVTLVLEVVLAVVVLLVPLPVLFAVVVVVDVLAVVLAVELALLVLFEVVVLAVLELPTPIPIVGTTLVLVVMTVVELRMGSGNVVGKNTFLRSMNLCSIGLVIVVVVVVVVELSVVELLPVTVELLFSGKSYALHCMLNFETKSGCIPSHFSRWVRSEDDALKSPQNTDNIDPCNWLLLALIMELLTLASRSSVRFAIIVLEGAIFSNPSISCARREANCSSRTGVS